MELNPKKFDDVQIGDMVTIINDSNELEFGTVEKKLTKVAYQQFGQKVKLKETSHIGRVKKIHPKVTEQESLEQLKTDLFANMTLPESDSLEFKATFLTDERHFDKTGKIIPFDKGPHSVAKTIAAFANQRGGTLYIGIKDEPRKILGLSKDYSLLPYKQNSDGFLMKLKSMMESTLGLYDFHSCVKTRKIISIDDKDVCIIQVKPSKTPIVLKHKNQIQLYVREGDDSILYENIQPFCHHWYEHMKELEN